MPPTPTGIIHAVAGGTDLNLDAALKKVVETLESFTQTRVIWPEGLLHPGGPHRRLAGQLYPISIGEDECLVFGRLVETFRPEHCFIIGNAFGLSAAYIAEKMREHGGKSVVTLDSQSEGDGQRCAAIAQELAERLELELLTNKKGFSPEDVPKAVEQPTYDLIFIDGLHRHPQVIRDLEAVLPYANERTLIVWHDYWIRGVPESVTHAAGLGFRCVWLPTSCEMVVGVRDEGMFQRLREAFPQGAETFDHPNYLYGYLLHLKTVAEYWMSRGREA